MNASTLPSTPDEFRRARKAREIESHRRHAAASRATADAYAQLLDALAAIPVPDPNSALAEVLDTERDRLVENRIEMRLDEAWHRTQIIELGGAL